MSAFRFRLLMPLAKIQTLFFTVLPLVYCPILWILYCTFWQVVPNGFLMGGLFFQCFGLMVWLMNVHIFRLWEPKSRAHLNRVFKMMGSMMVMMHVLAITNFVLAGWELLNSESTAGEVARRFVAEAI